MIVRVVISVFLGFMIASTGASFVPSLRMVTEPVLCSGGDLVQELPISNKSLNLFCQRNGQKEAVGWFPYITVSTMIFGAVIFGMTLLLRLKQPNLASESIHGAGLQSGGSSPTKPASTAPTSLPTRTISATATVLDVQEGDGAHKKRFLWAFQLVLTLKIDPPTGEPFETTVRWYVNELHFALVQVGCSFPVSLDADHYRQVYPATHWASQDSLFGRK